MDSGVATDQGGQLLAHLEGERVVPGRHHDVTGRTDAALLQEPRLPAVTEKGDGPPILRRRKQRVLVVGLDDHDRRALPTQGAQKVGAGVAQSDDDDMTSSPPAQARPPDLLPEQRQEGGHGRQGEREGRGEAGDVESVRRLREVGGRL